MEQMPKVSTCHILVRFIDDDDDHYLASINILDLPYSYLPKEWQTYTGDELGFQSFFGPVGVFILMETSLTVIMMAALHYTILSRVFVKDQIKKPSRDDEYVGAKNRSRSIVCGLIVMCAVLLLIVTITDREFVLFAFPAAYESSKDLRSIGRTL